MDATTDSAVPASGGPALNTDRGNRYAVASMLVAVALFAVMDSTMKVLSESYPAMQVAALRSLCSLPLVCAYIGWRGAFRDLLQVRFPLHLLRAAIGIAMLFLFVFGVRRISLAEAYTIFFVAPSMITVLSIFFLGERVSRARWAAIVVGLLGVVVVLRPDGAHMLTLGGLAIIAAAAGYAVSAIAGRVLARTERGDHMVFWLMLLMAGGAGALALPQWVPVRAEHGWLLLCLAVSGFLAQLAVTEAFGSGEASVVAPFEYTALAWATAIDFAVWRTLPDRYTLLGAAIIIASGVYLIRHESGHAAAEHP